MQLAIIISGGKLFAVMYMYAMAMDSVWTDFEAWVDECLIVVGRFVSGVVDRIGGHERRVERKTNVGGRDSYMTDERCEVTARTE